MSKQGHARSIDAHADETEMIDKIRRTWLVILVIELALYGAIAVPFAMSLWTPDLGGQRLGMGALALASLLLTVTALLCLSLSGRRMRLAGFSRQSVLRTIVRSYLIKLSLEARGLHAVQFALALSAIIFGVVEGPQVSSGGHTAYGAALFVLAFLTLINRSMDWDRQHEGARDG